MPANAKNTIVIGGGIIGLATAWAAIRSGKAGDVVVLDKEPQVAAHQTGHNSGVVHAGVYYPPDSLKARYCRAGVAATKIFCERYEIGYEQCGKLIVATDKQEIPRLYDLQKRAAQNGLETNYLERSEVHQREHFPQQGQLLPLAGCRSGRCSARRLG